MILAQEAHIHAQVPRQTQGVQQAGIGNEVGSGDPHPLAGAKDGGEVHFADALQLAVRPGLNNLHRVRTVGRRCGEIRGVLQVLAGGKIPILHEHTLEIRNGRSF